MTHNGEGNNQMTRLELQEALLPLKKEMLAIKKELQAIREEIISLKAQMTVMARDMKRNRAHFKILTVILIGLMLRMLWVG